MFWTLIFHIGRYSVSIRIMKLKAETATLAGDGFFCKSVISY